MVKFEEANKRLIKNIFVCKNCSSKIRAPSLKVSRGEIKCRKCKNRKLKPKRKK